MASVPHDSLLSRWLRSRRAPARPDPGDQGTAFGMELTFAPTEPLVERAPPAAPAGWLARLGFKPR